MPLALLLALKDQARETDTLKSDAGITKTKLNETTYLTIKNTLTILRGCGEFDSLNVNRFGEVYS